MKRWIGLALLIFVATAGWRTGDMLSPDALSMAIGVLFGVMAGVPTALLVMAGSRRRNSEERTEENRSRQHTLPMPMNGYSLGYSHGHGWGMPYAHQPPIVVVAGPQGMEGALPAAQPNAGWFAPEPPARQFTVVGDREALIEDW